MYISLNYDLEIDIGQVVGVQGSCGAQDINVVYFENSGGNVDLGDVINFGVFYGQALNIINVDDYSRNVELGFEEDR